MCVVLSLLAFYPQGWGIMASAARPCISLTSLHLYPSAPLEATPCEIMTKEWPVWVFLHVSEARDPSCWFIFSLKTGRPALGEGPCVRYLVTSRHSPTICLDIFCTTTYISQLCCEKCSNFIRSHCHLASAAAPFIQVPWFNKQPCKIGLQWCLGQNAVGVINTLLIWAS